MTPVRAFLVDLDGTLADTADANFSAYAAAFGDNGLALTRDSFEAVAAGRSWRQFLPLLLAQAGSDVAPEIIARRKVEVYATLVDRISINTALVRLLSEQRPACRTALVTTASAVNAHRIVAVHNLASLFDTIVTGDDVVRHKPDPEAYHLAASRLDVAAGECIVFEDSDVGVASATAFGASVLRINFSATRS